MANFNSFTNSDNAVGTGMFGANTVFELNTLVDGSIRQGYLDALVQTGVTNVRFPGGMVEIDFNVMRMDGGQLREEVATFLQDVRGFNDAGHQLAVTIVLPTQAFQSSAAYTEFARAIADEFSDVVEAFEIGNEYSLGARNPNGLFSEHPEDAAVRPTQFGLTETIYGQQVERIVQAVDLGLRQAQAASEVETTGFDPDILIQMSDISGAASLFKGTNDHGAADRAILSQISATTMNIVDGYIGHYYYNDSHSDSEAFDGGWRELRSFDERIDSWMANVGTMFGGAHAHKDIVFTEWNTNIRTVDQLGLKGASVLAKQIEYMVDMGVDSAFVWPLQHNTNSTIAGHYSDPEADLSPAGQVFSILNSKLNSDLNGDFTFRLMDAGFSSLDGALDVGAYASQYESIFVFSNRSYERVNETVNFGNGFDNIVGGTMHTIGIDQTTSDGLAMGGNLAGQERLARRTIDSAEYAELASLPYFDASDANHIKVVNGSYKTYLVDPRHAVAKFPQADELDEFWFVAEPDVSASVAVNENVLSQTDGLASVVLNPFEVAIVVVAHSHRAEGNDSANVMAGNHGADILLGREGNDTLYGYEGDDTLKGGWGDDLLYGGAGNNALTGSLGNDWFVVSEGRATIDGGDGIDTVDYSNAAPSIRVDMMFAQINTRDAEGDVMSNVENLIGTHGSDNIRGTQSDNLLSGGRNVDYIFGRQGDDTLQGGIGNDVLFGGPGADVLRGGANRDRAQYSESAVGLTVDLGNAAANTGEAAGDVFFSIEDLAGSRFADTLRGNGFDNRLFGRDGRDTLVGRGGDDYLNGGGGGDILAGGAGDDVLRGGAGGDLFIFTTGHDVYEDFALGTDGLNIRNSGFTGYADADLSEADGNTVMTLDDDDSITLLGVSLADFSDHFGLG